MLTVLWKNCKKSAVKHYIEKRRGHSKSTFIEERGGGGHLKANKNEQGEGGWGGGGLSFVYVHFKKKNADIFKIKFYRYSPVFPIDYNGSMKY